MQELESLAHTADIATIAWVVQSRSRPDPAFFIGQGKVEEVGGMAEELAADVIIFNSELSPAQARNLEERLSRKVIDRAQLIMDIFAQRAMTKEARLQVELAQLRYLLPRLRGWGEALTRLGGGIGTRGPGETQLELDRDKIKRRIHTIKQRLVKAEKERALRRKRRKANPIPKVVLVGYTNSGKSTLLNRLCGAGSPVGDKLFATLSIVVRRGDLQRGRKALFIDTVGFITDLPHHLIPAFAATLEAVQSADLLLHVVDLGNPRAEENYRTVLAILNREVFSPEDFRPPTLDVLNKVDLACSSRRGRGFPYTAIRISA
jgi:GTP-binding protein HflX